MGRWSVVSDVLRTVRGDLTQAAAIHCRIHREFHAIQANKAQRGSEKLIMKHYVIMWARPD